MKRVLEREDGTATEFRLKEFQTNGPIRVEILVSDLAELRAFKRNNKLISVRMEGARNKSSTQPQVSLVPWGQIEEFDWDA